MFNNNAQTEINDWRLVALVATMTVLIVSFVVSADIRQTALSFRLFGRPLVVYALVAWILVALFGIMLWASLHAPGHMGGRRP